MLIVFPDTVIIIILINRIYIKLSANNMSVIVYKAQPLTKNTLPT